MLNIRSRITIVCMVVVLVIVSAEASVEYYVSPSGNDSNPGTIDKPFATPEAARNAIRQSKVKKDDLGDVTVYLKEGVYELVSTFELKEKDSGSPQSPVVYQAYPGQTVRLIGGKEFPAKRLTPVTNKHVLERIISTEAKSKVMQIDLKALGITDFGEMKHRGFCRPYATAPLEVFFNHQPLVPTSYPKDEWLPIKKVLNTGSKPRRDDFSDRGGSFIYESQRPLLWKDFDDLWIHGMFGTVWADDTLKIASIDPKERKIETFEPHLYGITGGHFQFQNILEEITSPRDYYVDRKKGIVYLWPPDLREESIISVSMLESPLVAMVGCSYTHFKNLVFEVTRGIGIYIERGQGNRLFGCTVRNTGSDGICIGRGAKPFESLRHEGVSELVPRILGNIRENMYADVTINRQGGRDHGIVSCDIYNCGSGGVSLGGGDRMTLTPAGNFVENCHIHHINRLEKTYRPCVDINGVGNRVSHCLMHDATHSAIIFYGNDHVMEYNRIHDVILESDDGGAFYTGRDPSAYGNVIRYNLVYKAGSTNPLYRHGYWHAVYLDDFASGITVENNVFVDNNVGVLGSGWDTKINNNIIVNTPRSVIFQTRPFQMIHKNRLKKMNVNKPPFSERYPTVTNNIKHHSKTGQYVGSEAKRNVAVSSEKPCVILDRVNESLIDVGDNIDLKESKEFSDITKKSFVLKADSVIYQKIPDFKKIPFEKIGLYQDSYRNLEKHN